MWLIVTNVQFRVILGHTRYSNRRAQIEIKIRNVKWKLKIRIDDWNLILELKIEMGNQNWKLNLKIENKIEIENRHSKLKLKIKTKN